MAVESIAARAPLRDVEVAVVGAGPVGLMVANLLGIAGVQVAVLEANEGLLGLPRAIAYDAETLRLFFQVGLLDDIKPGLIQNPRVRHLNARGRALMEERLPGLRTLWPFRARYVLPARIRARSAQGPCAVRQCQGAVRAHRHESGAEPGRCRSVDSDPPGRDRVAGEVRGRLRRWHQPGP